MPVAQRSTDIYLIAEVRDFRLKIMRQTGAIVNRARRLLKRLRHEKAYSRLDQRFYALQTVHLPGQITDGDAEDGVH